MNDDQYPDYNPFPPKQEGMGPFTKGFIAGGVLGALFPVPNTPEVRRFRRWLYFGSAVVFGLGIWWGHNSLEQERQQRDPLGYCYEEVWKQYREPLTPQTSAEVDAALAQCEAKYPSTTP